MSRRGRVEVEETLICCYQQLDEATMLNVVAQQSQNGVWRSPVARLLWEQEVPGSNPGAPMDTAARARA
jgi:hypothetical protein